jgi:hypothetical protein
MRKVYWDACENNGRAAIFRADVKVIYAGTTLHPMSVKAKNKYYQEYADKYGIRFIFDDSVPQINFYTVPQVDVFAKDRFEGLFGTVGQDTEINGTAPICFITENRECFLVANSLKCFCRCSHRNTTGNRPCGHVVMFSFLILGRTRNRASPFLSPPEGFRT